MDLVKLDSIKGGLNNLKPQLKWKEEQSEQQTFQFYDLLNQINKQIISTLDIDQVLTSACQLLAEVLQCSRVSILEKEYQQEEFITKGEYKVGDYPSQLGMKVSMRDNLHLQLLISQDRPLAITKFREFPGLGEDTKALIEQLGIQSILAVSVRYQGSLKGIIGVHQCDRQREWTKWEIQLLDGVASQLAIAIHHAQLYTEIQQKAEQEALLRLVGNQIRSSLDLNTILQTAVRGVRQVLNADRVVIYQFIEGWKGEIKVEDCIVPWPSVFGEQITDNCFPEKHGQLYEQGRVRVIPDIYQDNLDPCHLKFLENLQVRANLVVPIIMGSEQDDNKITSENQSQTSQLWGLLIAHQCETSHYWKTWEIEGLQQLADQMAIAINQAELYAQVQENALQSQLKTQQLEVTLEELRATQIQLIQSEKLSSLGQMVAGIAHEINNPNNFIYANTIHAKSYVQSLIYALDKCAELSLDVSDKIEEINEEIELDFIREDFPKLLKSIEQGSDRIRSIVSTLKDFSHLNESKLKSVDLTEGLESSLAMLEHQLNPNIQVIRNYQPLPKLKCQASQINQVFFHLLNNAIDAIQSQDKSGKIIIKTEQKLNRILISIQDNGCGIPEDVQPRIFDPFFTTKPVGQGTGMGLAVCYQVIVKGHGGKIDCYSQEGEGTEFIIELPL